MTVTTVKCSHAYINRALSPAAGVDSLEITLPYPPSVNSYWRSVRIKTRNGMMPRVLISRKGREYRTAVVNYCRQHRVGRVSGDELEVRVIVCPPDNRRRDIDNIAKSLLDALEHAGIYADDSMIHKLVIRKSDVCKDGAVHVTVRRLQD